jgi:hypothetical protein
VQAARSKQKTIATAWKNTKINWILQKICKSIEEKDF